MSEVNHSETARIVVSCDSTPLGTTALRAAAALAHRLNVELAGVFVENVNLLRMAALPFAREYTLTSAAGRRVEASEIERTLRRQADAMRGALSRAAHDFGLPWSFHVVRGRLLDSVLEAMREPDLAVFGYSGQYSVSADIGRGILSPRTDAKVLPQTILVPYDDTPAAGRALATANALAEIHHTGLLILVLAGDPDASSRLRMRAVAQLKGSRHGVRFQHLPSRGFQDVKRAVMSNQPSVLLWHGVQTFDERKAFNALVDVLKCPVVLVL
jgi:nucleotide-binding universal stress UspA family protein